MRKIALSLALLLPFTASAVPMEFSHQGRLFDTAGVPIDGSCLLDIGFFSTPSGGAAIWSDSINTTCDNGYFHVQIGEGTPIEMDDINGDVLWMQLSVNSAPPLPGRIKVVSVPYAVRAGQLTPGADIDVGSILINGTTVIDSSGAITAPVEWSDIQNAPPDTLSALSCADGEISVYVGSDWMCGPANSHEHDADQLSSGTLTVARLPVGLTSDHVAAGDHVHSTDNITSGVFLIDRMPIGDTDTDVAIGNHDHDGSVITGGTIDTTYLDVGTATGTVAAGDHGHDGAVITSGTIDSAYLDIGTASGTVAAGDHSHTSGPHTVEGNNIAPDDYIEVAHNLGTPLVAATGWFDDGGIWTGIGPRVTEVCPWDAITGSAVTYSSNDVIDTDSGPLQVSSFTIDSGVTVTVTGSLPLVIESSGPVDIEGVLVLTGRDGSTINSGNRTSNKSRTVGLAGGGDGGGTWYAGTGNGDDGTGPGRGEGAIYGGGCGYGVGGGGAGHAVAGADGLFGAACGSGIVGDAGLSVSGLLNGVLVGGSGGGGGAYGTATNASGGAGGAGGGAIRITAPDITIAGDLFANGGHGGDQTQSADGGGGGGGAGGSIWLQSENVIITGNVSATGGRGGTIDNAASSDGGAGGAGSAGRIRIDSPSISGISNPSASVGVAACSTGLTEGFQLTQPDADTVRLYNRDTEAHDMKLIVIEAQ